MIILIRCLYRLRHVNSSASAIKGLQVGLGLIVSVFCFSQEQFVYNEADGRDHSLQLPNSINFLIYEINDPSEHGFYHGENDHITCMSI